jgi:hypothetical protein
MNYEIGFMMTWVITSAALIIFMWLSYLVPRLRSHMMKVFRPAKFNEVSLFHDTLTFFEENCPTSDIIPFIIVNSVLMAGGLVLTGVLALIWPLTLPVLILGVLPIAITKMIPRKES